MSETELANENARVQGPPQPLSRVLLAVVVAAIFIPAVISVGLRTDLAVYLRFAEEFALSGKPAGSNYLFPQATIIARALIPFGMLEGLAPGLTTDSAGELGRLGSLGDVRIRAVDCRPHLSPNVRYGTQVSVSENRVRVRRSGALPDDHDPYNDVDLASPSALERLCVVQFIRQLPEHRSEAVRSPLVLALDRPHQGR